MSKERAVELLKKYESDSTECLLCTEDDDKCSKCGCEHLADFLVANGAVFPPIKFGSEIFISPDRGEHFHKAKLYGCDEKGVWLVWVNDNLLKEEDKHIVANPMKHTFYDWFINIYTREEAEAKLRKEDEGNESEEMYLWR